MRRLFVRAGGLGFLFYASCGGRTTLVDLSEQAAGDTGVGGVGVGGSSGGKAGNGGKAGKGGGGGATGGTGGSLGGKGGGPAGTGGRYWCDGEPCKNGGTCVSLANGYRCNCLPGTFGEDCSGNIDDCDPNPCVNGECEDRINSFNCDCDRGYTGERCEIPVDDCSPNPCQNGGTCIDEEDGFSCDCAEGWRGRTCEMRREPCNPNPCQNGGLCTDLMNDFQCACPAGYAGKRCQTVVGGDCVPNPCQNGGTCVSQGGGAFTCDCPSGFSPPFCQCRGDDEPMDDGSCVVRTVCGRPVPLAFGSGDCSDNTEEFADWWCQLGGYRQAESYTTLTSGVVSSLYYSGRVEQVLSTCAQVVGPANYGFQGQCTGVTDLTCSGAVDNALRGILMACGDPARDPQTFVPPGVSLTVSSGCVPNANTQALMVTRNGHPFVGGATLRSYLHEGGIVITEYSTSDELWNKVFPPVFQPVQQLGSCMDNVPTIVQFSPMDPFWRDNPFPMLSEAQTGCGYSVAHYPFITPLAGWDAINVGLGYRNVGQGRFWAADFDWQDRDQNDPSLPRLLGYMVTHRR